jgi:hypothetical protein
MMALELLDTKWAGVIQPDPDSDQAGDVETERDMSRSSSRVSQSNNIGVSVSIRRQIRPEEDFRGPEAAVRPGLS